MKLFASQIKQSNNNLQHKDEELLQLKKNVELVH